MLVYVCKELREYIRGVKGFVLVMIVFFESFKFWLDRVWGERRVVLEEIRSLG